MSSIDSIIIELLKKDPQQGLERLIDSYTGYAYTIVYNKLQGLCTAADIEECVSDVFLNIYKIRHDLDSQNTSLKALVSVIANLFQVLGL